LGDELAQPHRLAESVEARLHCAQEETKQATQALKKVQGIIVEQCRVAEQEKVSLQANFEEEKVQMQ
jgi:hypothetical protein